MTRTVKKFDEKRNEKRVEIGQIGRVTERKMDPVIQYTGRKVRILIGIRMNKGITCNAHSV